MSHSARSAWIETVVVWFIVSGCSRRTPQGVRGLKPPLFLHTILSTLSHSARSAWIETYIFAISSPHPVVALRKECVD